MPEPKRIVFSTESANDQGGVIPNACIDFSRFNANPVLLKQHNWDGEPLGKCTDLKLEGGKWKMLPVFHGITEDSKLYSQMYEAGYLNACSIGGEAIWEEDAAGRIKLDNNGNRICKKFILYEISMVTLPSNADAVAQLAANNQLETKETLATHIYNDTAGQAVEHVQATITKLSSKYFNNNSSKMENEVTLTAEEQAAALETAKKEKAKNKTALSTTQDLPEPVKGIVEKESFWTGLGQFMKTVFGAPTNVPATATPSPAHTTNAAPAPKDTPEEKKGEEAATVPQPTPIGLKAKEALDHAKEKLEDAHKEVEKTKEAATKTGATAEHIAAYEAALAAAKTCMEAVEACQQKYDAEMEDDEEMKAKKEKEKAKNAASGAKGAAAPFTASSFRLKTTEELKAMTNNLAPAPKPGDGRVIGYNSNIPKFSTLYTIDKSGKLVLKPELDRISNSSRDAKDPQTAADARFMLASILKDEKFRALAEGVRFCFNMSQDDAGANRQKLGRRPGFNVMELMRRFEGNDYEVYTRNNSTLKAGQLTKLNATDDFLASPDVYAIEFLTLVLFQLFPSNSWKKDIAMFGSADAENNAGLVWTNIEADPTIYVGSRPNNPTNYTYTDAAVSIQPVPFFLQPMLWYPYLMHQLRYDQMGTGWSQAFAKWAATIDDYLIYQLAAALPSSSYVYTSGISGYQTNPQNIAIGQGQNKFYWNSAYAGNVYKPVINDILSIEQVYQNQNYQLENASQKPTLVLDPIASTAFGQDPQFQSLLTRWIDAPSGDFVRYSHTDIAMRSRVAVYNPATNAVIDPLSGSVPSTALGANLGFIPSQAALAISALDVFMVQDPTNYGYKMSADMRIAANWLRNNYYGGSLYLYNQGIVTP